MLELDPFARPNIDIINTQFDIKTKNTKFYMHDSKKKVNITKRIKIFLNKKLKSYISDNNKKINNPKNRVILFKKKNIKDSKKNKKRSTIFLFLK
mgnify:CR=1 FL=1